MVIAQKHQRPYLCKQKKELNYDEETDFSYTN